MYFHLVLAYEANIAHPSASILPLQGRCSFSEMTFIIFFLVLNFYCSPSCRRWVLVSTVACMTKMTKWSFYGQVARHREFDGVRIKNSSVFELPDIAGVVLV